jgi:hypothetical protein
MCNSFQDLDVTCTMHDSSDELIMLSMMLHAMLWARASVLVYLGRIANGSVALLKFWRSGQEADM